MSEPRREVLADGVGKQRKRLRPAMMPQTVVTIYALCDPITSVVRYIGKTRYTTERRLTYHMSASTRSRVPSANWMRGLREIGLKPVVIEIEKVDVDADWQARERFWIAEFRARGAMLLNLTDGGDGGHGRPIAGTDHAKKISETLKRGAFFACETCGAEFWRKPSAIKNGDCRYCSRKCFQASLRGVSRPVSQLCKERGIAAAALLRREQTHCKRGHPLSGSNVFGTASGARGCKECRKIHKRNHLARSPK